MKIHRDFAPKVLRLYETCKAKGLWFCIVSAYRSLARQQELYDVYLTRQRDYEKALMRWEQGQGPRPKRPLPAAKPGSSGHNYGVAVDYAARSQVDLQRVGEEAERLGLRWGGRFKDPIHIDDWHPEKRPGIRTAFHESDLTDLDPRIPVA